MDHSEASHDKPKSSFERISKWRKHMMDRSSLARAFFVPLDWAAGTGHTVLQ